MTQTQHAGAVPDWTLGCRLDRSLRFAGMSVEGMAHELDVSRSTVSRWINDRGAPPKPIYLRAWAAATGVDLDWLVRGYPTNTSGLSGGIWTVFDVPSPRIAA